MIGAGPRWWRSAAAGAALASLPLAAPTPARAQDDAPPPLPREGLPLAWTVASDDALPARQVAPLATRLGARVTGLRRVVADAAGVRVQWNLLATASEADADRVEAALRKARGEGPWVLRAGTRVAEIVCPVESVATRALAQVAWSEPAPARWTATFDLAPVESCTDFMAYQPAFERLLARRRDRAAVGDDDLAAALRPFRFADGVTLPVQGPDRGVVAWSFDREPRDGGVVSGGRRVFAFDALPREDGVPLLRATATVSVIPFAMRPPPEGEDRTALVAPCAAWPADAEPVRGAVREALAGAAADAPARERLERLLRWTTARVEYGGDAMGSRWGTLRAMEQRAGRCWDRSDVLVTLCRAAGIPARQVGGWVRGMSGHVWLEAFVDGGWLPVDATTSWLGVSGDYLPLWTSDDGSIPFLWRSLPVIEPAPAAEGR